MRYEAKLKACHSVSDIRTASEKNTGLKEAFIESVQTPIITVCDRFSHLHLKDEQIMGLATTATDQQLEELFDFVKKVDGTLTQNDSMKADLCNKTSFQTFMSKHCQIRHYVFQIKKCSDTTCTFCLEKKLPVEVFSNLPWIPDPVPKEDGSGKYLPYEEIVGK